MKRILFSAVAVALSLTGRAQCGMTVSMTVTPSCAGYQVAILISGGVAPYTICDFAGPLANQGLPVGCMSNYLFSSLVFTDTSVPAWLGSIMGSVNVSDVNGCTAHANSNTFTAHQVRKPNYLLETDCATGLTTVRWQGDLVKHQFSYEAVPFSSCSGSLTFQLDQTTGDVSSGWIAESTISRLFPTGISGGNHELSVYNTSAPICSGVAECWEQTSFSTPAIGAGDCGVNFRLRAGLAGPFGGGPNMSDALRAASLIPTTQPYSALGYSYVGSSPNVTIAPSLLAVTGDDAVVDWVVVELRISSSPNTVVYSKPALIQRDGDVIDTDGNTNINCPVAVGSYYVAIRHRNHLAVMTGTVRSLVLDPANTLVDFRTSLAYGNTPQKQINGVYCLWAGDTNGDGVLKYTGTGNDRDPILLAVGSTTPNNTVPNVYDRRDTNLDGVIKYSGTANDRDIILTNVGSTTPNNTRTQQLP
jgi:hypothetical protein